MGFACSLHLLLSLLLENEKNSECETGFVLVLQLRRNVVSEKQPGVVVRSVSVFRGLWVAN